MKKKIFTVATISAITIAGLTACSAPVEEYSGGSTQVQHVNDLQINGFSDADVAFMDGMAPHHEQAVIMSQMALTKSSNESVKALAQQIIDSQTPEIATLRGWIAEADPEGLRSGMHVDPMDGMDHQGNVSMGMLTESEMSALNSSSGPEFDKLYLMGMINHHEGAVAMANGSVESDNVKVSDFAKNVIKNQQAEIAKMKGMLTLM